MKKKKMTTDKVRHIADLCNLSLSQEEIDRLAEMLGDALDYIDILNELETAHFAETYQVTGLTNVFQDEDDPSETLTQKEALQNAGEVVGGMFATEAIFDR